MVCPQHIVVCQIERHKVWLQVVQPYVIVAVISMVVTIYWTGRIKLQQLFSYMCANKGPPLKGSYLSFFFFFLDYHIKNNFFFFKKIKILWVLILILDKMNWWVGKATCLQGVRINTNIVQKQAIINYLWPSKIKL